MKDQDQEKQHDEEQAGDQPEAAASKDADQDIAGNGQDESADAELETLQAELHKHKELVLRIQAEAENQRKRIERDFDKRRRFALESFMRELIGVRDSLERGLDASSNGDDEQAAAGDAVTPLREGMQMTLKQLDKTLSDNGLSVVDPLGEAFDPERHEAVTMQPSSEQEPGTVLQVIQKGYCLHDRLLRPAMVIVAKAAE